MSNGTATSLAPSAEQATARHCLLGAPASAQLDPEFVERYMRPEKFAATRTMPSADEATEVQYTLAGGSFDLQVAPPSTEIYIGHGVPKFPSPAAINRLPSAEQAMQSQYRAGAPDSCQLPPEFVEV